MRVESLCADGLLSVVVSRALWRGVRVLRDGSRRRDRLWRGQHGSAVVRSARLRMVQRRRRRWGWGRSRRRARRSGVGFGHCRVGVALLLLCCSVACLRRRLCVRQSFVLVLPGEWIWQSVKEDPGWWSSDWCSLVVLRRKTMSVMFCLKKEFQPPDKWGHGILYRWAQAASVVRNSLLLLPCRHCRCQSSRDT